MIAHIFWAAIEHMVYLHSSIIHSKKYTSCSDGAHRVNIDEGGVSFAREGAGAAAAATAAMTVLAADVAPAAAADLAAVVCCPADADADDLAAVATVALDEDSHFLALDAAAARRFPLRLHLLPHPVPALAPASLVEQPSATALAAAEGRELAGFAAPQVPAAMANSFLQVG